MVNYGYSCDGWSDIEKSLLARRLRDLVDGKKYPNIKCDVDFPYVEIDNLYDGVRIRKITYLSDEEHDELIKEADKIFLDIKKTIS